MKQKNIKINYLFNFVYQVLIIIIPLVTTPYLSRILCADGIGTYSFANAFVSYFALFANMGTSLFGQRKIAYVRDDPYMRTETFWSIIVIRVVNVIVTLTIYYILVAFLEENNLIYILFSLNIISVAADISWFFQGMEEFRLIAIRDSVFRIISVICIFSFVKGKNDLVIYIFIMSCTTIISYVSFWSALPRFIIKIKIKNLKPWSEIRDIISLFVPSIAIQVYIVLDKTMIGIITRNNYENGFYESAIGLSKSVLIVVTSLSGVLIPRIGYYYSKKMDKELRNIIYQSYKFVWMIGTPLCLGLISISDWFVPWYFGSGYARVILLIKITALLIIVIGISNVTGMQYLIPTNRQKYFTYSVIIGALVNLMFNFAFIPLWGALGAAISSVIAEIIIAIVQLIIIKQAFSVKKIIISGGNYYFSGGIMYVFINLEKKCLHESLCNLLLIIVSGGVVYLGMLFLVRDEFWVSNVENIQKKIKLLLWGDR